MADTAGVCQDAALLMHLVRMCDSLPAKSRERLAARLCRVNEKMASVAMQSMAIIERRVGSESSYSRQIKVNAASREIVGKCFDVGSAHRRKYYGISTSIRKQAKKNFNWNSQLGKNPDFISISNLQQIEYNTNNTNLTRQLQVSYTCPEIGDRLLLGGEVSQTNYLMVLNEEMTKLDCLIALDIKDIYAFTYINGYEIYVTNESRVIAKGEDLLRPLDLNIDTVKFYYNSRPNMNRGLVTDKKSLYILARDKDSRHLVYSYQTRDFRHAGSIRSATAVRIDATRDIEDFAINDRYLFGVYSDGHIVRIEKKDYKSVIRTKIHDNVDNKNLEFNSDKWRRFPEYWTTIAANNMVVVTASDTLKDRQNTVYIRDPKTLRVLDKCAFDRSTDYSMVCPIHQLKLLVIKDLCLVAALSRMRNVFLFMLRGNQIHKLNHGTAHDSLYAIWGIMFNKITNELIIHGNGGFLSKTRISIKTSDQDSSTTGRLEADGHAPSIMPEAQCSVVNSFNVAIEHLAALRIKDGKHGRSKKSNFI